MMTLSEFNEEKRQKREKDFVTHLQRCLDLLASSADKPLYTPPPKAGQTVDVSNYTELRVMIRSRLESGSVSFYDLACDHCGTELINHEPGALYFSHPPVHPIACPGCGWRGWT
jgi:hypothetical protein